jgi:hypothetical protein
VTVVLVVMRRPVAVPVPAEQAEAAG